MTINIFVVLNIYLIPKSNENTVLVIRDWLKAFRTKNLLLAMFFLYDLQFYACGP